MFARNPTIRSKLAENCCAGAGAGPCHCCRNGQGAVGGNSKVNQPSLYFLGVDNISHIPIIFALVLLSKEI